MAKHTKKVGTKKSGTRYGASLRKRPSAALKNRPAGDASIWSTSRGVTREWHSRNLSFWNAQSADVRGATGGGVSQRDLAFTRIVLDEIEARFGSRFERALDCGAGIGRVSDAVLRHSCKHIDLVEFVKKHFVRSKAQLAAKGKAGCTFSHHNLSIQAFQIQPRRYELVWCQWLLMYLTDADVLAFLKRARTGLTGGGLLLVKENIATQEKGVGEEKTYFDDAQGELWSKSSKGGPISCVRTVAHYSSLFERAGLACMSSRMQDDLGDEHMDMMLFILVPTKR